MVSGIPRLGTIVRPKNTLSPPERLFKHRVFEVGATVGARRRHTGWRLHCGLRRADVLIIFMHVDATQMLPPTCAGD